MLSTFGSNAGLLSAMNQRQVEYVIAGGFAVNYYCSAPSTTDLDILINSTLENAKRVLDVCRDLDRRNCLEYKLSEIKAEMFTQPGKSLRLHRFHWADLIVVLDEMDFPSYLRNSVVKSVNSVQTHIISCGDLIANYRIYNEHLKSNPPAAKDQRQDYEDRICKTMEQVGRLEKACNVACT